MRSECPRQCMSTRGTPVSAATSNIWGSARPPETSLSIDAPAARACRATTARVVSTEIGVPDPASSRMTAEMRRISSSASIRSAPGRVDSPPTSIMSAPAAIKSRPWSIAASRAHHLPPSENESGVTLITPIIWHRDASSIGAALVFGLIIEVMGSTLTVVDQAHGLGAGSRLAQLSAYGAGDRLGAGFTYAAHRHAQVLGFDNHNDAAWPQNLGDGLGDLGRESLLDLRPARIRVNQPRQFTQSGDAAALMRDVADVRAAVKRHQVVLAHRPQFNVFDQDQFIVAHVEGAAQYFFGVLV